MKNESRYGKKFDALLKQIRQEHQAEAPDLDPIDQLVVGFLEWNATAEMAAKAHEQLMAELVDNNDLRVSLPQELVALIGPKYPQAAERMSRLRDVLNEIYTREHAVSLGSLVGRPKKQVRAYIADLTGITPYVAAQVMLLGFAVHAMPMDDRIARLLCAEGVVDPNAGVREIAQFVERRVKAGDAAEVHRVLRAWADSKSQRTAAARAVDDEAPEAKAKTATTKGTARSRPNRKK